jgi:hypothetical protein
MSLVELLLQQAIILLWTTKRMTHPRRTFACFLAAQASAFVVVGFLHIANLNGLMNSAFEFILFYFKICREK